jgi:hypothetical protein
MDDAPATEATMAAAAPRSTTDAPHTGADATYPDVATGLVQTMAEIITRCRTSSLPDPC